MGCNASKESCDAVVLDVNDLGIEQESSTSGYNLPDEHNNPKDQAEPAISRHPSSDLSGKHITTIEATPVSQVNYLSEMLNGFPSSPDSTTLSSPSSPSFSSPGSSSTSSLSPSFRTSPGGPSSGISPSLKDSHSVKPADSSSTPNFYSTPTTQTTAISSANTLKNNGNNNTNHDIFPSLLETFPDSPVEDGGLSIPASNNVNDAKGDVDSSSFIVKKSTSSVSLKQEQQNQPLASDDITSKNNQYRRSVDIDDEDESEHSFSMSYLNKDSLHVAHRSSSLGHIAKPKSSKNLRNERSLSAPGITDYDSDSSYSMSYLASSVKGKRDGANCSSSLGGITSATASCTTCSDTSHSRDDFGSDNTEVSEYSSRGLHMSALNSSTWFSELEKFDLLRLDDDDEKDEELFFANSSNYQQSRKAKEPEQRKNRLEKDTQKDRSNRRLDLQVRAPSRRRLLDRANSTNNITDLKVLPPRGRIDRLNSSSNLSGLSRSADTQNNSVINEKRTAEKPSFVLHSTATSIESVDSDNKTALNDDTSKNSKNSKKSLIRAESFKDRRHLVGCQGSKNSINSNGNKERHVASHGKIHGKLKCDQSKAAAEKLRKIISRYTPLDANNKGSSASNSSTAPNKKHDDEISRLIKEHPDICRVKYDFPGMNCPIYPLSILCAIGSSLSTVSACHDAFPKAIKSQDIYIGSPLHYAVYYSKSQNIEIINFLIEQYPKLTRVTNNFERNPLHLACMSSQASLENISFLVSKDKIIATYLEKDGCTPLHLAVSYQAPIEVIQYLMEVHPLACVSKTISNGHTPLHVAIQSDSPLDVVRAIIKAGPKALKVLDNAQQTPLHIAVNVWAKLSTIQVLYQVYPSAATMENVFGKSPVEIAASKKNGQAILKILKA